MKPNTLQRLLLKTYRGGQFANLKRGEDLRLCGDEVFIGLYNALDDSVITDAQRSSMDPARLAMQRLDSMRSEIGNVIGMLGRIQQVPADAMRDTMAA